MANFEFEIHRMTPMGAPKYNVLETDMEGWKQKTRLKSTIPRREWSVEIRGRTNAERDLILAHWTTQKGTLTPFNWVVPSFFGGATYYVRYVSMEYENPTGLGNVWNFSIVFKESI